MSDYVYIPSIEEEPQETSGNTNVEELIDELKEIDEIYSKEASSIGATLTDSSDGSNKLQTTRLMATIPQGHSVISSTIGKDIEGSVDQEPERQKSFGDMTIKQLYSTTGKSMLDILTELFSVKWDKNFFKNLIEIFSKEDRLLSTGILMVMISVLFLAIRKT